MTTSINEKNSLELKEAVERISIQTDVSKEDIIETLEYVIIAEFSEYLNVMDDDLEAEIDDDFTVRLFLLKEIVEEVEYASTEISKEEASQYSEETELGEFVRVPVDFTILNRRTIQHFLRNLHYNINTRATELIYKKMLEKKGTIVTGKIIRKNRRDFFIDIGKVEGRLPFWEQSPGEIYKQGSKIKVLIKEVELNEKKQLNITLSRADTDFIKELFALEVPEITEGAVVIDEIVRIPGKKIKMSVRATKTGVEPVGACVGLSGVRINAIIREINNERIDVIPNNGKLQEFITRALQPAKVKKVLIVNEEKREVLVIVDDESYPLAIGKGGTNIKLATEISNWSINLKTESQIAKHPEILDLLSKTDELFSSGQDSDLQQLTDIDEEILVKFMNAGIMTIAELYEKSAKDIAAIDGIDMAKAKEIRTMLDEMVEIIDDDENQTDRSDYMSEIEDEIEGVNTDEKIEEEIKQVEFLVCPSCNFEFEYTDQTKCPSCGIEFEFEEEEYEEEYEEIEEDAEENDDEEHEKANQTTDTAGSSTATKV